MTTMTQEQYLEDKGCCCPHCRSRNIWGMTVYAEGGKAWQQIECHDCGETWTDQYVMTGFTTEEN